MKEIRKLLVIILSLLLLVACVSEKQTLLEENHEETIVEVDNYNNEVNRANYDELVGKDYIDLLKNYVVRKKNIDNVADNIEFESFLNEIFVDSLEEDYLSMHYTVADYRKYGIEKPALTIGELEYCDEPDNSELIEELTKLQSFDFNSLSYKQQYDYECLEYSLFETLAYSFYEKYDQLFTGKVDLLANLVVNFDEFVLYDEESIEDYLILLEDFDNYLDKALIYFEKQAENGLYLTNSSIDYTKSYVRSFTSKVENNALISSFNKKIDEVDFVHEELKEQYKLRNKKIIEEEVIPAFQKVANELEKYRDKTKEENNVLSRINKEYSELTYMIKTSSNMPIDELFDFIKESFDERIALFNTAADDKLALSGYYGVINGVIEPFGQGYDEILSYLEKNYVKAYPDLGKIDYKISNLDASSASNGVVAYYVPLPIDKTKENIIRVNPNLTGSDYIEDFVVLAHEGIPGHMYQYNYNSIHNINKFRNVLAFYGYQEGYACYCQNEAFNLIPQLTKEAIDIIILDSFSAYLLESVIDIGVNYYDWNKDDVANYLKECGYNASFASSLFNDVVDRNSVLISYGAGYLFFDSLKEYAKKELNDKFDEVSFNETLLKNGQLPFNILRGAVQEYIDKNK